MKKNYNESKLQQAFCEALGYYKSSGIDFFAVPNGDRRGGDQLQAKITGARLKKEGVLAGVSDLIVLANNDVIFVEMKDDKGRQSTSQRDFEKMVKSHGHNYIVLHNWEECEQFIRAITDKGDFPNLS